MAPTRRRNDGEKAQGVRPFSTSDVSDFSFFGGAEESRAAAVPNVDCPSLVTVATTIASLQVSAIV